MRGRIEIGTHRVVPPAEDGAVRRRDERAEGLLARADRLLRELERELHELEVAVGQLSFQRRNTTHALWPPKPNELFTATSISCRRASFGM